jgi:hypothetical protein
MPAFCIVVVHHHGIDTQFDHIGLNDPQTPNEKGLQKAPEQKDASSGKCFEKASDLIRRGHIFVWCLNATGIVFIARNQVEVCQSPTNSIDKKRSTCLKSYVTARFFRFIRAV